MIFWRKYKIPVLPTYQFKRRVYTSAIMSLDTETTTVFKINGKWQAQDYTQNSDIYRDSDKRCFVYIWQFAIDDEVIYGRDITDFFVFWDRFITVNPNTNIVYVHNLGYDFEFLCEYTPTDTFVFARAAFKPMYVKIPTMSIELRCSYMLTNMSLEDCAEQFNLPVKKLVGAMAYNVIRLPNTPLTEKEMEYCEFDVRVINSLIREIFLKRYSCVADIPLTQTGEVRRDIKTRLARVPYHLKNMQKIKPDLTTYTILTKLLQGGYTHLNYFYFNTIVENVVSFDKSSSYPDVMCTREFPLGKFRVTKEYIPHDKQYSYILYIRCEKIRASGCWAYIARHKVKKSGGCKNDNGKLNYCDYIEMWVTDVDFEIIKDNYRIEDGGKIEILEVYKSYKGYLPKEFILAILEYYGDKTKLKGVDGMGAVYMQQKQKTNSCFGMTVTNDIRDEIVYNPISHAWETPAPLTDEDIIQLLHKQHPFLSYAWGVWVTAYARDDIFRMLMAVDFDAVYSDTDSIKMINADRHLDKIERFNRECDERIDRVCRVLNIQHEKFYPLDKNGEVHPLGHFELDGKYKRFLSIGSKKYCFENAKNGEFKAVVAGLQKQYIDIDGIHKTLTGISDFKIDKSIHNARTIHWHLTDQQPATIFDDMGNSYTATNKQGIAIMRADYTFSVTDEYDGFVLDMRNKYTDITRLLY